MVLARRYNVTEATIRKWRATTSTVPTLPAACKPHSRPPKEAIAVYLRRNLLLSLDDLLAVMREFVCPSVSRSGLDRCFAPARGGQSAQPHAGPREGRSQAVQAPHDASRRRRSDSARASASNWPQSDGGRPLSSILRNTR